MFPSRRYAGNRCGAVPIYAQSLPANAQSPQISYVDCARVTEENSTMPDDRLGYAEDWSFYI